MGALKFLVIAAMLCAAPALSPPVSAQAVGRWREPIAEASRRFGVPIAWIEQVIRAESAGRTRLAGRPIVSAAGAMGLMQLMPGTWRDVRARLGLGHDPHEPRDNILAGTFYLRAMYDAFGYPGLFAAYNAGPARLTQYRRRGRPLPRETRAYVAAISERLARMSLPERPASVAIPMPARASDSLFFVRRAEVAGPAAGQGRSRAGLFIALSARPGPGGPGDGADGSDAIGAPGSGPPAMQR